MVCVILKQNRDSGLYLNSKLLRTVCGTKRVAITPVRSPLTFAVHKSVFNQLKEWMIGKLFQLCAEAAEKEIIDFFCP